MSLSNFDLSPRLGSRNRIDPGTDLVDYGAPAAYAYGHLRRWTPDATADPRRRRPPWLVAEVLGTGRLPDAFVRALLAWFQRARTHLGAVVVDSSLGGGDPSPTRPSSLGDNWMDGESAYGDQEHSDFSILAGAKTLAGAETLGP